jgi:hypothetical protein
MQKFTVSLVVHEKHIRPKEPSVLPPLIQAFGKWQRPHVSLFTDITQLKRYIETAYECPK